MTFYLQFHARFGCSGTTPEDAALSVEQSSNSGQQYKAVLPRCTFGSTGCQTYGMLLSETLRPWSQPDWRRFTLALPATSLGTAEVARFAWHPANGAFSWALTGIYVGSDCPLGCSGHGNCTASGCVCDAGFVKTADGTCAAGTPGFATSLLEDFESGTMDPARWAQYGGGVPMTKSSSPCRHSIAGGRGFVFYYNTDRLLETVDLNLTAATMVLFTTQPGDLIWDGYSNNACNDPSSSENLYLAFSTNGGIEWHYQMQVSYSISRGSYGVFIPFAFRTPATRVLWFAREMRD